MIGFSHPARALRRIAAVAVAATFLALPAAAQTMVGQSDHDILASETYVRPPAVVDRIIMAARTDITFTLPSPDRKWFLKSPGLDRGDVAQFGKPHLYLGGLQVDAHSNRARSLTNSQHLGLQLVDVKTNVTKTIETPKGVSISSQVWSPSGTQIAYIANFDDASQIMVADVLTGKSVQVTKTPLLATLVTTVEWTADGKSLIAVVVPDGRGPAPVHGKNGIEDGPEARLTESRVIPQVIHPSLLEDPHEKALLKYYTTGQLVIIDVKTKVVKKIGAPGMIRSVDASPDGQYFRVTEMTEPFSYLVPVTSFGSVQELWDVNGKVISRLNKSPLREGEVGGADDAPAGGGRGGGRGAAAASPAGRGTAPARPAPTSVRYMSWMAPFGPNDTKLIYEGSGQLTKVDYKTMFVSDSVTVTAIRSADPSKRFSLGRGVTIQASGGGRGGGGGFGGGADTSATGGALATKRGPNGLCAESREVFAGTRTFYWGAADS